MGEMPQTCWQYSNRLGSLANAWQPLLQCSGVMCASIEPVTFGVVLIFSALLSGVDVLSVGEALSVVGLAGLSLSASFVRSSVEEIPGVESVLPLVFCAVEAAGVGMGAFCFL